MFLGGATEVSEIQGEHPNITGTCPLQPKRLGQIGLSFGKSRLMGTVSGAHRQFFNFVLKLKYGLIYRFSKTQMAENGQILLHILASRMKFTCALEISYKEYLA